MSSGYGGTWDYAAAQEATERRRQRAQFAVLRQRTAKLRAQAEAARRLGVRTTLRIDDSEPATNASSAELAARVAELDGTITTAGADLDRRMNEAWMARLGVTSDPRTAAAPRESAMDAHERSRHAKSARHEAAMLFTRDRDQAAVAEARVMLAGSLTRCDPGDVEELEHLAAALRDGDLASEQALRRKVADSIAHRAHAAQTTETRERLLSLVSGALPAERAGLRAMIRHAADPESARVHVERAVLRADQVQARASVAAATAEALRDLGCDVGEGFATFLNERGAVITGLRDFPGYGVRIRVSESEIETLVVRRIDAGTGKDLAVQQAVCAKLDTAWGELHRAGVGLSTYRRVEPGTEPVPNIGQARWAAEFRSTTRAAETAWQPDTTDVGKDQHLDH
jgi:hypothetical protein